MRKTDFHPHDRFVACAVQELARIDRQLREFGDCEEQGNRVVRRLRDLVPWKDDQTLDTESKALRDLLHEPDFVDLLPFVLEKFASASGYLDLPNRGPKRNTDRELLDSFYTPLDLARWLASQTAAPACAAITARMYSGDPDDAYEALRQLLTLRVCDMSCGSGILLREALRSVESAYSRVHAVLGPQKCLRLESIAPFFSHGFLKLQSLFSNAYGIDIAPQAVQAARTVLIVWAADEIEDAHLNAAALDKLLGLNVQVGSGCHWSIGMDELRGSVTTDWLSRTALERETLRKAILEFANVEGMETCLRGTPDDREEVEVVRKFPEVFVGDQPGFSCILGNPPFGSQADERENSRNVRSSNCSVLLSERSAKWQYPKFVEGMYRFTRRGGFSAIVTPLNFAYGREFLTVRSMIETAPVQSSFTFFDRSPDALFGDKVKTRNIVLTVAPSKQNCPEIRTTHLLRWTRSDRPNLWKRIEPVNLAGVVIGKLVPKLGKPLEVECWKKIRNRSTTLRNIALKSTGESSLDSSIYVNATAYNWLPAFRRMPEASLASPSMRTYAFRTAIEADVVYSCLVSSLSFWLWTVESDGFHLTDSFIASLPFVPGIFSAQDTLRLSELSQAHDLAIRSHPTIKWNAGLKVLNFNRQSATHITSEIDAIIAGALDLPAEFLDLVHDRVANLVYVGRERTRATAKIDSLKERYAKVC